MYINDFLVFVLKNHKIFNNYTILSMKTKTKYEFEN